MPHSPVILSGANAPHSGRPALGIVILSGVSASRSEASTQSKDPYRTTVSSPRAGKFTRNPPRQRWDDAPSRRDD